MSNLPSGYLQNFPVQYHRHQVATGTIVQQGNQRYSAEISFGRSFNMPRNRGQDTHNAIDIMGARGLRIVAACGGRVARYWRTRDGRHGGAGTSTNGGNFVVIIDDNQGYYHYYAHMQSSAVVSSGDIITPGQLLGYLGDSGKAKGTPPHLHYQVSRRNNRGRLQTFLNPYPELFRLASRSRPQVNSGGRVVIPIS